MPSDPNKCSPGGHIIFEKRGFSAYFLGVQTRYWCKHSYIFIEIISKTIFSHKRQNATYYDINYDIAHIRHIYSKISKIPTFSKFCSRTKNHHIMGWADLLAAHQAHFEEKNSKSAWNKSSAHSTMWNHLLTRQWYSFKLKQCVCKQGWRNAMHNLWEFNSNAHKAITRVCRTNA